MLSFYSAFLNLTVCVIHSQACNKGLNDDENSKFITCVFSYNIIFLESLILDFFLVTWPVGSQFLCVHVCSFVSGFFAIPWTAVLRLLCP